MPRYVALLRAINVGGRTVKMDVLKPLFAELQYHNIETYLASGNVLFDSNAKAVMLLRTRIEAALQKALGFEVETFLRTSEEMRAVSAKLGELSTRPNVTALNVGFLHAPVADLERHLSAYRSDIDDFVVDGRELSWLCAVKQSQSEFEPGKLEKKLKLQMTFRGANTVRQLAERM